MCDRCGAKIDVEKFNALFNYANHALRYGHQYRKFYERQASKGRADSLKPCLADLPEVYKYVALAIASGIIGGASWELTKTAIAQIIEIFGQRSVPIHVHRIEPTIDEEIIAEIASDVRSYANGLGHMGEEVGLLVIEEMHADSVKEYLDEMIEIYKILEKPKKREKNRKRAMKLQKKLMKKVMREKLNAPEELPVSELWSKLR